MYIVPDTIIKIYSGIPLDNSYENTLWFENISAQNSYFHGGLSKYTLAENSYQRVGRGKMRVGIQAENLYDCNYLAFQNSAFGNKWFYAFILNVDYINNETSEITFEIDIMQTYYFDVQLKECFVEREHSITDEVGDNLVPENLELGEYVDIDEGGMGLSNYKAVLMVAQDPTTNVLMPGDQAEPTIVGNTLQCVKYLAYDIDSSSIVSGLPALKQKLQTYSTAGNIDAILGLYLIPSELIDSNYPPEQTQVSATPVEYTKSLTKRNTGTFEGYSPKNNKLFTYPYNFLYVTNMCGNSAVYHYELFSGAVCPFKWYGVATANTEIILFPRKYKNVEEENLDEAISVKGFPQCAYNVDAFRAWLAQNTGSIGATILATAIAGMAVGGFGGAIGGPIGWTEGLAKIYSGTATVTGATATQTAVGIGGLVGVTQTLGKVYDHAVQPTQTRGNDTTTILSAIRKLDFRFFNKRIRGEFAKIIDEYFTMYGYATHRVKIPNTHARTKWTYTKTRGCNIVGHCPADDIKRMKEIYDKGITFWVNANEVGNYHMTNSIIT